MIHLINVVNNSFNFFYFYTFQPIINLTKMNPSNVEDDDELLISGARNNTKS